MGNGFGAVMDKYGAVESAPVAQSVEAPPADLAEQGYANLIDLLNANPSGVQVVRYKPGKYTSGGYGLHMAPRWQDSCPDVAQQIHDLFWSAAGQLLLERHSHELFLVDSLADIIPEEEWLKLTA